VEEALSPDANQSLWIDQFILRGIGPGRGLAPFAQAVCAAELLISVAQDRARLTRPAYDTVGTLGYQAVLLADFARSLEADLTRHAQQAEVAVGMTVLTDADASDRARRLMTSLSGAIETFATLTEVCHAMLVVAEGLLVVDRPKSRIELMAAVEALRATASTALVTVQANVDRITDAVLYDRLEAVTHTVQQTLNRASNLSSQVLRASAPAGATMPSEFEARVGHGSDHLRALMG
jgi:hypothetical protein